MALFPDVNKNLYNDDDLHVIDRLTKFYTANMSINATFWNQADIDMKFEAGDQSVFGSIYTDMSIEDKNTFSFNLIRRVTNMISGHQRKNRKSTIIVPVENGDEYTADQYTKLIMWLNQQEGILDTVSRAFHSSTVTGLSLLQTWVDYRRDPESGDIKVDYCPYNSFFIDPYFKKPDLSDCNAIWKRSFLPKRMVQALLPNKTDIIAKLQPGGQDKFNFIPESFMASENNLLAYDEYFYRDYRKQTMLIDTQTGEVAEWSMEKDEKLNKFLSMYKQIKIIEQEVPTVKLIILVEGKVLYDGPNPLGIDRYPFIPVFGYYRPELNDYSLRLQGVVRGLRDAQYLFNRRKRIELDILESQINSGFMYKAKAVADPKHLHQSGQGRSIVLSENATIGQDIQQLQSASIDPSQFNISQSLKDLVHEISGASEELLGAAIDDKAGILAMVRQSASLTTLQTLFDQLDTSQKLLGRVLLETIQSNFSPAKVKRILNQEPAPQFYRKAFGKYDAAIEEGLNTTTQRQMQFAQLLQLKELGVKVPDSVLIDAITVQNKKQLKEAIEQANQQEQQMQQMEVQSQMQESQARTELTQARALADRGLGAERISRIKENQALAIERQAEAEKDDLQALLNAVKALKELDNVDLDQVSKILQLKSMLIKERPIPGKADSEL